MKYNPFFEVAEKRPPFVFKEKMKVLDLVLKRNNIRNWKP